MAKRRRKRQYDIRRQRGLFKTAESRTLEEFLIASIVGGITGGVGFAIGNAIFKWLSEEANKTIPLPETFMAQVRK